MGLLRPRLLIGGPCPGAARIRVVALAAILATTARAGGPRAAADEEPAPAAEPAAVTVRFVEPAPPGLILGETRVTVEAAARDGTPIARVEIHVDGRLLSVLEKPPWTLTWNAGTRFRVRVLRAVAVDARGRTGEAVLEARPLIIGQYEEVRLVTLYATARDTRGRPLLDLAREDFTILEDGVVQTLSHFSPARRPLALALLIDASNSMNLGGRIDLARKAAEDFIERVEPEDRLMILHFNDAVHGDTAVVADRARARAAIAAIRAEGGTALYDAIVRTAGRLAGEEGRRVIVLLSDGRDQALESNEPGSLHLFEEAMEKAHRAEAAVYAIGLGRHLDREMDLTGAHSLKEILDRLARDTGGRSYYPERAGDLGGVYRQIADDLKRQYALAYASTNRARDGAWRRIEVRARGAAEVQARRGYYGPAP